MDHEKFDFVVVGSGIAGLLSAHKLAALGRVAVLTKKEAIESNTNYAQGGIAAVTSQIDSFQRHITDTLIAGAGLCDEKIVEMTVKDAPARIKELQEIGVRFSQKKGIVDLGLEAGHSERRILHAGDITGQEIERALLYSCRKNPRIDIFENEIGIDLILDSSGRCRGLYSLSRKHGNYE